jgi:hypothetical protein
VVFPCGGWIRVAKGDWEEPWLQAAGASKESLLATVAAGWSLGLSREKVAQAIDR